MGSRDAVAVITKGWKHTMKRVLFAVLGILLASVWLFTGCTSSSSSNPGNDQLPELAYVGSDACAECHGPGSRGEDYYTPWKDSGHPYKLVKINGEAPVDSYPDFASFPNDFTMTLPGDYTWQTVSYVIGGYGWKMRWIADDGFIVTGLPNNQYNFEDQSYSDYHSSSADGTVPYNCGRCHTTGWVADADYGDHNDDGDLTDNQDGLPGMAGTFFAGGIHCEACHGMGSQHVYSRDYHMTVDSTPALCSQCHYRNEDHSIAASGGFIKHHEQYDEWSHSPHNSSDPTAPGCDDCHDPHSGVVFDSQAAGQGVLPAADCAGCHPEEAAYRKHNSFPECLDCHMPDASKSAIKHNDYSADDATHIWKINTDAVGKTEGMFSADGSTVLEDGNGKSAITLDFACYGCHTDSEGVGGEFSQKTLEELSTMAQGMHTR